MKFNLKKIIAFVLTAAFMVPAVDFTIVSASTQMPVPGLSITRLGGTATSNNIKLSWDAITNHTFDPYVDFDQNGVYETNGVYEYEITYYNATENSLAKSVASPPKPPVREMTVNGVGDKLGSLFSFRVIPYHYENERDNQGNIIGRKRVNPPGSSIISETLLMTDIQVLAQGKPGEMTVTWDDPKFKGLQVFSRYNLYISTSGDQRRSDPIQVTLADCEKIAPDPVAETGARLRYTYKSAQITPGTAFNIAVEPCDANGKQFRYDVGGSVGDIAPTKKLIIGALQYNTTFSPSRIAYEKRNVYVPLSLRLNQTGSDRGNLKWFPEEVDGDIDQVLIFRNTSQEKLKEAMKAYVDGSPYPPAPYATVSGATSTYPVTFDTSVYYYGIVAKIGNTGKYVDSEIVTTQPTTTDITPNRPDIYIPEVGVSQNPAVTIYWDAFVRAYVQGDTVSPEPIEGQYYDTDVTYEIYISDTTPGLEKAMPITIHTSTLGIPEYKEKGANTGNYALMYHSVFGQYSDDTGAVKPFDLNKNYYVKIVAKKPKGAFGTDWNKSQPSYSQFFLSITGNITSPSMFQKPPLSIRKDANGNEVITKTSIDASWLEQWSEVFDKSSMYDNDPMVLEQWQTKAARVGSDLLYGEDADGYTLIEALPRSLDLTEVRSALGVPASVPARILDIRGSLYEAKIMPYGSFIAAVNAAGSYDVYLEKLRAEGIGTNGWGSVTPTTVDENGNLVDPYISMTGLTPNTSYAILIRPYKMASDNKTALIGYPNYVTATTIPEDIVIDATPTPPHLICYDPTENTVTVKWEVSLPMDYELVISDVYFKDIDTQYTSGMRMSYEDIQKYGKDTYDSKTNKKYKSIVVSGLLPETEYYFWGRTKSPTGKVSSWSNPAECKTLQLGTVAPPEGFGLASADDLKLINLTNGTKHLQKDKDYITIEWLKNSKDPKADGTGAGTAVADILTEPTITGSYIAKFKGLLANKVYYFRAKTVLTVTRGEDGRASRSYAYLVQVCEEPDFINAKQIYVPAEPVLGDPSTYKQVESEWTSTVYYRTIASGDDYDSDFDPDLVPLPGDDFEITFDSATNTLVYRFRTGGKDASGNYDNRVDQRFITKLVTGNIHNYNIDVTKYNDFTVKNRVVDVPYTLLKTFEERKINFGIKAGNITVTLPPGVLDTQQIKSVPDFGDKGSLKVTLIESPNGMPVIGVGDSYASTPQQVALTITAPQYQTNLQNIGKPLGIKLRLNSPSEATDSYIGAYTKSDGQTDWTLTDSAFDKTNGQLELTGKPGMFAAVKRKSPDTVTFDNSTVSMMNVNSAMNITDLTVYNGNATATSNQIINVLNAIASNKKSVEINKVPDASVTATLEKAGMKISPNVSSVSREQAISLFVRLYELKTKTQIKPTYTMSNSPYSDIGSCSQGFETAMLKAAEIDILNGDTSLRPKATITLGEVLGLADVVIADSGM